MHDLETLKKDVIMLCDILPSQQEDIFTNTIAHIFKHDDGENFISDWLAYLIDPSAFGTAEPLQRLLYLTGCEEEQTNVTVVREFEFRNKKRRIDFFIETDSLIIGIENKIWSDLGQNQLKDYQQEMEKICKKSTSSKRLVLILLYPSKNSQRNLTSSIAECKLYDFCPISYENLINEYKQIIPDYFSNLRSAFLLQDFIIHMEEHIVETKKNITLDFEMITFTNDNLEKIKQINAYVSQCKTCLKEYITNRMREIGNEYDRNRGCTDRGEWSTSCSDYYFQLYRNDWLGGKPDMAHFELFSVGDRFPPKKIKILLHTHEGTIRDRSNELFKLGKQAKSTLESSEYKESVEIDYSNGEKGFNESFDEVFNSLRYLVEEYTLTIDAECNFSR